MTLRLLFAVLTLCVFASCGEDPGSEAAKTAEEKTAPSGSEAPVNPTIVPGTKTETPATGSTTETITPPPAEGAAAGTPPATPPPAETSLLFEHPCTKQPEKCYPLRAAPNPIPTPNPEIKR